MRRLPSETRQKMVADMEEAVKTLLHNIVTIQALKPDIAAMHHNTSRNAAQASLLLQLIHQLKAENE
jgi:hypothetical protein